MGSVLKWGVDLIGVCAGVSFRKITTKKKVQKTERGCTGWWLWLEKKKELPVLEHLGRSRQILTASCEVDCRQ